MPGNELFGAEERKEIMEVLETGIFFRYNHDEPRKGIWKSRQLEQELAHITGAEHAHMVSSGSTAIATALAVSGLGAGDEVIVPPFTYVATVEAVLLLGAIPVFAEIDETLCLSPEGILKAMTPKTRGIALVHMCGSMARMDEIMEICARHNLILVEDAAQALGTTYKGRHAGTFGHAGSFSFDFFKIITAAEGGAVITNNSAIYDAAAQYSDHGHDHIGNNRGMEQHPIIGFNYRISELHAAIALGQIRKVPRMLEIQRANKAQLVSALKVIPQVSFRHFPDPDGDAATFLDFFLPTEADARSIAGKLAANGLAVNYWYDNMYHYLRNWDHVQQLKSPNKLHIHTTGHPGYANYNLPQSDALIGRLISIGIRLSWTAEDIVRMQQTLAQVISAHFAPTHA
ncbi:MAG: DegT/DnrJ/EryC1/StrS family aminotransferase [Bacteroidetes bacterium]|nr:DegT/DnrJ/EryC1/StrS family aminotransferase [Bacteroidota bacterium]